MLAWIKPVVGSDANRVVVHVICHLIELVFALSVFVIATVAAFPTKQTETLTPTSVGFVVEGTLQSPAIKGGHDFLLHVAQHGIEQQYEARGVVPKAPDGIVVAQLTQKDRWCARCGGGAI